MPVVTVTLITGYDEGTKTRLSERLTDAVMATIGAPADGTTVILHEVAPDGYMRGRGRKAPGAPPEAAGELVARFLRAMEARDLDAAGAMIATDFRMVFPGGIEMTTLSALGDWAKGRYRRVTKSIDRIDEVPAKGAMVVYCFGTLEGEWLDGEPFGSIRFIDRFTVRDGKILDQRVWNDMGEVLSARNAAARDG